MTDTGTAADGAAGAVDNFSTVRSHLDFQPGDMYIVHILRRKKDTGDTGDDLQRLIRTYYVDSQDYLAAKEAAIKDLCRANSARAYILPQPRDNMQCLFNAGRIILDLASKGITGMKPDRLMREAYCGLHQSRLRRWVVDLDGDNMDGMSVKDVCGAVAAALERGGRGGDWYTVPTRHGVHIVSGPFNLHDVQHTCRLMFEGVRDGRQGWLHKDGMTLLYCS